MNEIVHKVRKENVVHRVSPTCSVWKDMGRSIQLYHFRGFSLSEVWVEYHCLAVYLLFDLLFSGVTIKLCNANRLQTPEDKTFYTEEDFRDFLARRGWTFLREYGGYRNVESLDDLRRGAIYQGMRSLGDWFCSICLGKACSACVRVRARVCVWSGSIT